MADDEKRTHVALSPAAGVTDLEEWFGRLDDVMHIQDDPRWSCERESVCADLPVDEAARVIATARNALGDAVEVQADDERDTVVTETAGGVWIG